MKKWDIYLTSIYRCGTVQPFWLLLRALQRQFPSAYVKTRRLTASISSFMLCWKDEPSDAEGFWESCYYSKVSHCRRQSPETKLHVLSPIRLCISSKLGVRRIVYPLCCPFSLVFLKSWKLFRKILLIRPLLTTTWFLLLWRERGLRRCLFF